MNNDDAPIIELGPPRKSRADWFFTPRPSEVLDAAEVTIISVSGRNGDHGPENGADPIADADADAAEADCN